jgi:NitT/TauT family transport system substrate-binding protein
MRSAPLTRRRVVAGMGGLIAAAATGGIVRPARAAAKVRLLTSWYAEAEHGGFYQAKATGLYERAGLDVEIKMGGPQLNSAQLLVGGDADLIMGWDIQTLVSVEKRVPMVAVASSFQFELQGIVTHADVKSLADLKGHTILVGTSAHTTFWPWMKERYGFAEDQAGPYSPSFQRFVADSRLAQQGYLTHDGLELQKLNVPSRFFLLADDGYPPYGSPIVTTRPFLEKNGDLVARFVRASLEGWVSYLKDPAAGNRLIKADNPQVGDDLLAYSARKLASSKAISGGDAATLGVGIITEARWKKTRDFLVRAGLLKESTDWKSAFTTEFVRDLHIRA